MKSANLYTITASVLGTAACVALAHCGAGNDAAGAAALHDGGSGSTQDAPVLAFGDAATDGSSGICAAGSDVVYAVSIDSTGSPIAVLQSFNPKTLAFATIGDITPCLPSQTLSIESAFGLGVDRSGIVTLVVGFNANVYVVRAKIADASCVATTTWPSSNEIPWGLGSSTDGAGSTTDTLYAALGGPSLAQGVGSGQGPAAAYQLGTLNAVTYAETLLGPLETQPNIQPLVSGTGDGRLYTLTYFAPTGPYNLRQRDKGTGAATASFPPIALPSDNIGVGAFVFWGGRFYIFYEHKDDAGTPSAVAMYDPVAESVATVADNGPAVRAAGVSTCAPVTVPQ